MFRIAIDEPKPIELHQPRSLSAALALWDSEVNSAYLAGGCDLLDQLKSQWKNPRRVINLKGIDALRGVQRSNNHILLGALTTLSAIANDDEIRQRAAALALAAARVATPQIRNVGTLGGNLLQDSRCPYYRGAWLCYRAGGIICDAHHGINDEHAVFGGDRCYTVSPSDTAPALIALDAHINVVHKNGEETWPIEQLFLSPSADIRHLHRLHDGRILTGIAIPLDQPRRSHFIKFAMRNAWDFALASIAVSHRTGNGGRTGDWRVVLGGVAATPWRLNGVERILEGETLTNGVIAAAARAATAGAEPLAYNAYKVPLISKLVENALKELAA